MQPGITRVALTSLLCALVVPISGTAKSRQDVAVEFVNAANRADYATVCSLYSTSYLKAGQAACRWLYGWGAQLYGPYDYRIVHRRSLPNGDRWIDLIRWHEASFIELAHEPAGWRIVAGGW